jgi:GAF domain-containing protein
VGADRPTSVAEAAEQLRAATGVGALLGLTAEAFVVVLEASACTISRVIGDLLVDLVQHQRGGKPNRLGHGYLISDYPLTRAVIETREPRSVYARDPDVDEAEATLLKELGFDSLLMLTIESKEAAWALVEVYAEGRRFQTAELDLAKALAAEAGEVLERLSQPAQ